MCGKNPSKASFKDRSQLQKYEIQFSSSLITLKINNYGLDDIRG
jgi:hypothetical protein